MWLGDCISYLVSAGERQLSFHLLMGGFSGAILFQTQRGVGGGRSRSLVNGLCLITSRRPGFKKFEVFLPISPDLPSVLSICYGVMSFDVCGEI